MSMKEWIVFGLSPCVVEWNDVQVASCRQIISHWCYRLIISELLTCYISVEGHEWCWGLDNLSIDLVGTNVEVSDPLIRLGHLWGSILVFWSFKSPRHFSIVTTRTKQMTLVKKIFQTEKVVEQLFHNGRYIFTLHNWRETDSKHTQKMTGWMPRKTWI